MSDQDQLCVVDSDTGQILYYFNSSTGEMNWVHQPPKEISDQTKPLPQSPSNSSVSESEEVSEPESSKPQIDPKISVKIEPKECSNLVSGEVVTVILEPCPDKKTCAGSSKVKSSKKITRSIASNDDDWYPQKRLKLEENTSSHKPSMKSTVSKGKNKIKPFICKLCQKQFQSKVLLSKHLDTHLGPRPFKCPRCYKGFRDHHSLAIHVKKHIISKPYECGQCQKSFSTISYLTVHMSSHSGIPPYTCQHCSRGFNHAVALTHHLATHLPHAHCRCGYCQQDFSNQNDLSEHVLSHKSKLSSTKSETVQQDKVLNSESKNQINPEIHQSKKSKEITSRSVNPLRQLQALIFKETPTYEANCVSQMRNVQPFSKEIVENQLSHKQRPLHSNLDKKQEGKNGLTSQERTSKNTLDNIQSTTSDDPLSQLRALTYRDDGPIMSAVSTQPMSSSSILSYSKSSNTGGIANMTKIKQESKEEEIRNDVTAKQTNQVENIEEKKLSCSSCSKEFSNGVDLAVHAQIHSKTKLIRCNQCELTFADESEFRKHVTVHENKTGSFACPKCGKTFVHSHGLNLHLRIHTGEKPFQCVHCLKCFAHSGNLTVHLRTHTGEKPFKCQYCQQAFNHSSNLKNHMRLHTGEKPYQCKFCDRSFSRSSHLRNHMINHTLGKLLDPDIFRCDVCDKPFDDVSQLSEHMKLHNETKPHICRFCGKSFTVPSGLAVHERTHTGEKPYKCPYCDRAFSHSSNMKVHVRTHTGEKPYHCKVCDTTFARSSDLRRHVYFQGCQKLPSTIAGIPTSSESHQDSSGEPTLVNAPTSLQGRTYPATVTNSSYVGSDVREDKQRENQEVTPFQRIKERIKSLSSTPSATESSSHSSSAMEDIMVEVPSTRNSTTFSTSERHDSNTVQPPPFLLSTLALKPTKKETSNQFERDNRTKSTDVPSISIKHPKVDFVHNNGNSTRAHYIESKEPLLDTDNPSLPTSHTKIYVRSSEQSQENLKNIQSVSLTNTATNKSVFSIMGNKRINTTKVSLPSHETSNVAQNYRNSLMYSKHLKNASNTAQAKTWNTPQSSKEYVHNNLVREPKVLGSEGMIDKNAVIETSSLQPLQALTESIPKFT